jgi:hypothetical protein
MRGTHVTGKSKNREYHPGFAGHDSLVSPATIARRLRLRDSQGEAFLKRTGLRGASWGAVLNFLSIGPTAPVCYNAGEVARMLAVSRSRVRRWVAQGILESLPEVRPIRVAAPQITNFLSAAGGLNHAADVEPLVPVISASKKRPTRSQMIKQTRVILERNAYFSGAHLVFFTFSPHIVKVRATCRNFITAGNYAGGSLQRQTLGAVLWVEYALLAKLTRLLLGSCRFSKNFSDREFLSGPCAKWGKNAKPSCVQTKARLQPREWYGQS